MHPKYIQQCHCDRTSTYVQPGKDWNAIIVGVLRLPLAAQAAGPFRGGRRRRRGGALVVDALGGVQAGDVGTVHGARVLVRRALAGEEQLRREVWVSQCSWLDAI